MPRQFPIVFQRSAALGDHNSCTIFTRNAQRGVMGVVVDDDDFLAGKQSLKSPSNRRASFSVCSSAVIRGITEETAAKESLREQG